MAFENESNIRQEICRFGKMLHEHNFVAATDGNISVRLGQNLVLCTPTSVCKGMMRPEDLVLVDMQGTPQDGNRNPSSELGMHLLYYNLRPEIRAVVHAHPPTATGFAAAGLALEEPLVAEVVITFGKIPLARYGMPGTRELGEALKPLMTEHDAILMAQHGVVTCGHTLLKAYLNMECVEHYAKIVMVARQLGSPQALSPENVRRLMEAREHYEGNKPAGKKDWEQ